MLMEAARNGSLEWAEWEWEEEEEMSLGLQLSCVLVLYALPLVCGLGVLLNVGALAVMTHCCQKGQRRETSFLNYLLALATFDLVQLLFILPLNVPGLQHECHAFLLHGAVVPLDLTIQAVMLKPLMEAASYAAIWVIVAIAVQRYFAVCRPFTIRRFRCLRSHNWCISLIATAALLLNLPGFWEFRLVYTTTFDWATNATTTSSRLQPGPLNIGQQPYYHMGKKLVFFLLLYLGPLLVLCVLTVRTVLEMRRSKETAMRLGGGGGSGGSSASSRSGRLEHRRTFLTLTIILLFVACQTLPIVVKAMRIAQVLSRNFHLMAFSVELLTEKLLVSYADSLVALNCAANPLLYLYFTRKFKDLMEKRRKKKSTTSALTFNSYSHNSFRGGDPYSSRKGSPRRSAQFSPTLRYPLAQKRYSFSVDGIRPLVNRQSFRQKIPQITRTPSPGRAMERSEEFLEELSMGESSVSCDSASRYLTPPPPPSPYFQPRSHSDCL